jgi:hypothetical protein
MEIDFATLREIIKRKYDGNTIETDFATLREIIKRKYDGNRIEIDSACLPQADEIDRNSA